MGVFKGDFANRILKRSRPERLYLIDPWKHEEASAYDGARFGGLAAEGQTEMDEIYNEVLKRFHRRIEKGQVELLKTDSQTALAQLSKNSLDWIYIDGNHQCEYIMQDLLQALRAVKPGGIISGDDYCDQGWWKDGVIRAVDEFVQQSKELELLEIRNKQFVIRVRD